MGSRSSPESDEVPPLKKQKLLTKSEIDRLRSKYIAPSLSVHYSKVKPLNIVYGRGQFLYDEKNQAYLDCINNVTQVGHCHPRVIEAFSSQVAALDSSPFSNHKNLQKYTTHLLSHCPTELDCVLFTNSGTEANDLALQIAEVVTDHTEIIALEGAYHGHSKPLMGLSSYKFKQQKEGEQALKKNPHGHLVATPDAYRGKHRGEEAGLLYAEEVKEKIDEIEKQGGKVSCFIGEAFVGCAGQVQLPEGYLKAVFEHVHKAGGLCIIDEIQTGFGRAGDYFWIFESQGVCPDIVTVGKPMGNGHPVSGVITTQKYMKKFAKAVGQAAMEQYCSDPISLAVADAVLTTIEEEGMQESAKKLGEYVMKKIKSLMETHTCIGDVRGYGLFIGVEIVKDRDSREPDGELCVDLVHRVLLDHRVMIKEDGLDHNVIKIKPPLCFTQEDADKLIHALDSSLLALGK